MNALNNFYTWIRSLFFQKERQSCGPNELTVQRQDTRETAKDHGAMLSFDDLIRIAEEKLALLKDMKFPEKGSKADVPQMVKNMGLWVYGEDTGAFVHHVEHPKRPQFLCVSSPRLKNEWDVFSEVLVLEKIPNPKRSYGSVLEPIRKQETLYVMHTGMAKCQKMKSIWGELQFCYVSQSGKVRIPKYRADRVVVTKSKTGGGRHRADRATSSRDIHHYKKWKPATLWDDPKISEGAACWALNTAMYREMHWSVSLRKDGYIICFSVPDNDLPRIFKKRDRQGKIFHAVRAHTRKTGSGEVSVKTHYRGSRHFTASGFDVCVQMPGKHRPAFLDFPDAVHADDVPSEERKTLIPLRAAAKLIGEYGANRR